MPLKKKSAKVELKMANTFKHSQKGKDGSKKIYVF